MNEREKNGHLKSLVKALNIFTLYSQQKTMWSVGEMVEALQYHKSSVWRLVRTLEHMGFLEKTDAERSVYRLGPQMFLLANLAVYDTDLQRAARPSLARLVELTQETSHFCVVDRSQGYYMDKIDSPRSIRMVTHIGQRLPLHCTGVGKALLSGMSSKRIDQVIAERGLPRFTKDTIVDRGRLLAELAQIRREGLAYDREEFEAGLWCVAAPLRDRSGRVVAAISVSGPIQRIGPKLMGRFAGYVKEAAREVSEKLGYIPSADSGRRDGSPAIQSTKSKIRNRSK